MGVTGLWRLIEPVGKPVPVETLENKVLAVDISIWLHQMVKGYQDAKGAPLPNAHLMGLFQRLCKLLYFRIKPIFVFDGAFPDLKRETIAKRQDHKAKYNSESERLKRELALVLSKKTAISSLLGKQISPKTSATHDVNDDDIFKLPTLPQQDDESEAESEEESSNSSIVDLHSVDVESDNFKNLPVKEKYELLIELKDTRKMNSWGKLHELPKKSDNFSDFQMQRLLKRRKVEECLQETEKEMGDSGMSLNDLESLLNEEGIDTKIESLPTRRIASNNNTRFLLINNVREALAEAKRKKEAESISGTSNVEVKPSGSEDKVTNKSELEMDLEKAIKMSLECANETDISADTSKMDDSWTSALTDTDCSDSEEDGFEPPDNMSTAKAYIMQYTDLTNKAIDNIVARKKSDKSKSNKIPNADQIIEELKKETYVLDNIDLSSSDDECKQVYSRNSNQVERCEDSVVELNTMHENLESNTDDTQTSVVCIENAEQGIICLDTSTEDDAQNYEQLISETDFHYKEKSRNEIDDLDEDLQRAIKLSLECMKEPKGILEIHSKDSDSSDVDFEEVPEKEESQKPVIQLTFNVGDAPQDDIFADIFKVNIEPGPACEEKITGAIKNPEKHLNINNKDRSAISSEINPEIDNVFEQAITSNKLSENVEKDCALSEPTIQTNVEHRPKLDPNEPKTAPQEATKRTDVPNIAPEIAKEKSTENKLDKDVKNKNVTDKLIDKPSRAPISLDQLNTIQQELQSEEQILINEKGRLDRIGRNITDQMTKEAQELLQIFGIPYIVAPTEAEAQCAFLESVKLTDGTITDDSDVWLFGGRTVYKNFFNQKKHVLQFLAERIEKSFKLSREQLILLALLVGSDYTTGVTGVGPVTALEILASFPFNKKQFLNETSKQSRYEHVIAGLQEFKQWVRAGKRTDNTTLKKKLRNVKLMEDFPSVRVVRAYLEPSVEESEDKFTWGELDITVLRDYTKAKFGWSQNKLDEIIKPVIKRIVDRKSQRSVQDYFKRKIDFHNLEDQMSKRVKAAVQKMGPEKPIQENTYDKDAPDNESKPGRKRKVTKNAVERRDTEIPGPSNYKVKKTAEDIVLNEHSVKVISQFKHDGKSDIEIIIPKSDRVQEIIPQREKEKHNLLQNKLKAIEVFRKTKIDRPRKPTKRKVNLPKEKAELSENSDSD